jgi:hypothetical protein
MKFAVSAEELAEFIDISERRVYQLVDAEIIDRVEEGKYNLKECAKKYYEFKFGSGSRDLNEVRAEHEEIKKRISEIKLAKQQNKVFEAEAIKFRMTDMITTFRNRILATPTKLAPQITGVKNTNKINDLMNTELREALEELSEYDPSLFVNDEDLYKDNLAKKKVGDYSKK